MRWDLRPCLEDFVAVHGEIKDIIGKSVVWGGDMVLVVQDNAGQQWFILYAACLKGTGRLSVNW